MRAVLGIAVAVGGVALLAYVVYGVRVQANSAQTAAAIQAAQGAAQGGAAAIAQSNAAQQAAQGAVQGAINALSTGGHQ